MNTELNLLVAMRALALGLIDDERFRVVCRGWSEDRNRSVEQRLVQTCGIDEATRQRLMEDVRQHVSLAGDDPVRAYQEELAQDSRVASLVCELDDDPVVAGTLDEQPRDGHVLIATLGEEPGDPTVGPNAEVTQMRYTLHRVYGKGGLGQVWMAQDRTLNRRVALKELKPGRVKHVDSPATRGILRRFLREAQITGQLQHPNIVPVYDVERRDGGLPFYTMKLVEGQTFAKAITDYHERRKAGHDDPVEFARLLQAFVGVCQAVAYANANGVVHRDLKPQNVVLGGFGEVIVLDWGEAKLVRPTNSTAGVAVTEQAADASPPETTQLVAVTAEAADLEKTCGLVGTPAYLSPEQAEQRIDDVDQRTDVYGLGTILFHVVAGISPHGSRPGEKPELDLRKLIDRIITEPTPRLRQFDVAASAALDAVCAKAMAKSQAERYASATELAKDVQRFLADEPVSVLSEPLSVRVARWMKRHRTLVATTAAALIVGIIGVSVLAAMSSRHAKVVEKANENLGTANRNLETANKNERAASERATQKANEAQLAAESERKAREQTEEALSRSRYFLSEARWTTDRVIDADDLLDSIPEKHRQIEWFLSKRKFEGSFATLHGHLADLRSVCISPDGLRIASASGAVYETPGQIIVWDAHTGAPLFSIDHYPLGVTCLCFSPDSQQLTSGGNDQMLRLWDAKTGQPQSVFRGHTKAIQSVGFVNGGSQLVSAGSDDLVKFWDVSSGDEVRTLKGHRRVSVTSDGRLLATTGQDKSIKIWEAQTGTELRKITGLTSAVTSMDFSADGRSLASANETGVTLWNVASGQEELSFRTDSHAVNWIGFSPDGQQLATAGRDHKVKLWNARNGQELAAFKGHTDYVSGVCFTPDGQRVISASQDQTVKIWHVTNDNLCLSMRQSPPVMCLSFRPNGKELAGGGDDKIVRVWDTKTGEGRRMLRGHTEPVRAVSYHPDGQQLASAGDDRTIRLWDAETGKQLRVLKGHSAGVTSLGFSPDGTRLASGSGDQTIKLWNAKTGDELRTLTGHTNTISSLSFSEDGQRFASASGKYTSVVAGPGEIKIWTSSGELLQTIASPVGLTGVALSPDGQFAMTIGLTKDVRLWDVSRGQEVAVLPTSSGISFTSALGGLVWSRDGQRLVVGNSDSMTIWDARTQENIFAFAPEKSLLTALRSPSISRDGLQIAYAAEGTVKVSGPTLAHAPRLLRGHHNLVREFQFSPDSRVLATTAYDLTIRLWDVLAGRELHQLPGLSFPSLYFRPDGQVLTATVAKGLKLFDVGTGQELVHFDQIIAKDVQAGVQFVTFSRDGQRIAAAIGNQTTNRGIKILSVQTGTELRAIAEHSEKWANVLFSADGQRVFARDVKNNVLCWDLETGNAVDAVDIPAELASNRQTGTANRRSPDGRWLAIPLRNHVRLIDRTQTLPSDELAFRRSQSSLNPSGHLNRAQTTFKEQQWYAATFHYSWLVSFIHQHEPSQLPGWLKHLKTASQMLALESKTAKYTLIFPRITTDVFAKLKEPLPTHASVNESELKALLAASKGNNVPTPAVANRRADVDAALKDVDFARNTYQVELETAAGKIRLDLFPDAAPEHCRNIIGLTRIGFYNGVLFHRVVKGFMIQTGCPLGTGAGGPGYTINAEFNDKLHEAGTLSMAKKPEPNSAGSQFFICLDKAPHLDKGFARSTVFGKTADQASLDVALKIGNVWIGKNNRPLDDIKITSSRVIVRPKD